MSARTTSKSFELIIFRALSASPATEISCPKCVSRLDKACKVSPWSSTTRIRKLLPELYAFFVRSSLIFAFPRGTRTLELNCRPISLGNQSSVFRLLAVVWLIFHPVQAERTRGELLRNRLRRINKDRHPERSGGPHKCPAGHAN